MRAVAYTEAVQTAVFVAGSLLLTLVGLQRARRLGRAPARARIRGVQPLEAAHPGGRRGHLGTGARTRPHGLVLQRRLSVGRDALLRADRRPLVLVHRSVHRPADARRAQRARGATRHDLRGVSQAAAGVHLHRPRHDCAGAGAHGARAGAGALVDANGNVVPAAAQAAFPLLVQHVMPIGPARPRGGRAARRAHELARRRVQRLLDALHHRLLPEAPPASLAGTSSSGSDAWRRR